MGIKFDAKQALICQNVMKKTHKGVMHVAAGTVGQQHGNRLTGLKLVGNRPYRGDMVLVVHTDVLLMHVHERVSLSFA